MRDLRLAILDLFPEDSLLAARAVERHLTHRAERLDVVRFSVRKKGELPSGDFQAYLVLGADTEVDLPAPPIPWVTDFLDWLVPFTNASAIHQAPCLLIGNAYALACRHFRLGEVSARHRPAYGVYPVHLTDVGIDEPLFAGLDTPFYAADFRRHQLVQPDINRFAELGAEMLLLEKVRPHVPLERAILGVRFSPALVGMHIHPEVDPGLMRKLLKDPIKREQVLEEHGEEKYQKMLKYLNETKNLEGANRRLIQNFLTLVSSRASTV